MDTKRHSWTKDEEDKLRELFERGKTKQQIADIFNLSYECVRGRMEKLGLVRFRIHPDRRPKDKYCGKPYEVRYPVFPKIIRENVYAYFWSDQPLTAQD